MSRVVPSVGRNYPVASFLLYYTKPYKFFNAYLILFQYPRDTPIFIRRNKTQVRRFDWWRIAIRLKSSSAPAASSYVKGRRNEKLYARAGLPPSRKILFPGLFFIGLESSSAKCKVQTGGGYTRWLR